METRYGIQGKTRSDDEIMKAGMSIHRHYLHNGRICEAGDASLFAGQVGLLSGWGVFSTLRVSQGALFAWEKHWARMSHDARLLNVEMPPERDSVEQNILRLIEANQAPECTLRLVVVRNACGLWQGPSSGLASDTIVLTADLKHWGESVRLSIQPHARYAAAEFTSAKMLSWAANLRWAERALEQGFDEVILLNESGRVAECTSANVFASFGSRVVTPPISEGCLPGVTRDVLVHEIHVPGVEVIERPLAVEELSAADGVFITSTTRGLLRVREIAGRTLENRGDACERLGLAFVSYFQSDIARRKAATVPA
jgi:branched-chain amino acid aminotransferase